MWFDTHCHLDAPEFKNDLEEVVQEASRRQIDGVLIPAVQASDFEHVSKLVDQFKEQLPKICFTLGVHPLYTGLAKDEDLGLLERAIKRSLDNPRFVGIGEIGLDYFVENLDNKKQEWFFEEQLKLAKKYQLPVILHVRRSQDQILKRLRAIQVVGGIAHAFNGSFVQAEAFLKLNFKLGVGGAMTYPRALQIRRLAMELPLTSFVLETDAPDIPPRWLEKNSIDRPRHDPQELAKIGQEFAQLRSVTEDQLAKQLLQNTLQVLPRLNHLFSLQ